MIKFNKTSFNEFIRFGIVGVLNTAVYYAVYYIALHFIQLHFLFAHWIGFFISLIFSFFINSLFTYRVKPTLKKFLAYPLTQIVNVSCSTVFLYIFVKVLHMSELFAPFIALLFTVPITFLLTGRILKDETSH